MIPLYFDVRGLPTVTVGLVDVTEHGTEPLGAVFLNDFQGLWVVDLDVSRLWLFSNPITFTKLNNWFGFRHLLEICKGCNQKNLLSRTQVNQMHIWCQYNTGILGTCFPLQLEVGMNQ